MKGQELKSYELIRKISEMISYYTKFIKIRADEIIFMEKFD